jgi:hypothetical protein
MRRCAVVLLAAAVLASAGVASAGEPSGQCKGVVATGKQEKRSAIVCLHDIGAVKTGIKKQHGLSRGAYVVFDGDSNSLLSLAAWCLAGYIGVQVQGSGLGGQGIVFGKLGDYSYKKPYYLPNTGLTGCASV